MARFISPDGNPEEWDEKPNGYFTQEEWDEINPPPVAELPSLEAVQEMKKAQIDKHTDVLRERDGKEYQGKIFAMSDGAKANWSDLAILSARGKIKYPKAVLTKNDEIFQIQNEEEMDKFLDMVEAYFTSDPTSPVVTGRALRMQVMSKTTAEEVMAIVDDRD